MVSCAICGIEKKDLSRHIKIDHLMTIEEYKKKYQKEIIDFSVDIKRKQTCLEIYGDSDYRNEEAKKLSFEIYENGHPFKDPKIKAKARETKIELYGDPGFTNRAKAKQTCLKKYGVDNVAKIESVVKKRVNTCLERYGKIFNYEYKPPFTKEDLIDLHINKKQNLEEIGNKFETTAAVIGYWMRKWGIPVTKRVVVSHEREFITVQELVRKYFEICFDLGKVLSFYEYGKIDSQKNMLKMKRCFNTGSKNSHLKQELFQTVLSPEKWSEFLMRLV